MYALGGWDHKIHVFNTNYASIVKRFEAHEDAITKLIFLPKKGLVISTSWDCTLKLWPIKHGNLHDECLYSIEDQDYQIMSLATSEDENLIAFGDADGYIKMFDIQS